MTFIKRKTEFLLAIGLTRTGGEAVAIEDVEKVVFHLGGLEKVYPGEVGFNGETGEFYFPLTREETAGFTGKSVTLDALITFVTGPVVGIRPSCVPVQDCYVED